MNLGGVTYSIRTVAEKTGLTAHTIRAWERRYGVLDPERSATNRRVYGPGDVERLDLLRRVTLRGHSIGMVATLDNDTLRSLLSVPIPDGGGPVEAHQILEGCRRAVHAMDGDSLDRELSRAAPLLGIDRFLDEVVIPLLTLIGENWSEGQLSVTQEHMATAIVRTHLDRVRVSIQPPAGAPRIVISTPAHHYHELGALIVAIVAARMNWNPVYLGPNLPAEEIATAVKRSGAKALALSIVYPAGDPKVKQELLVLGNLLSRDITFLAGGSAVLSYQEALRQIGARISTDLQELRRQLAVR